MIPLLLVAGLLAADVPPANPQIDYRGFSNLTRKLQPVRDRHRVTLPQFQAMAASGKAVILDARSADAFAAGHIAGAINLPLTDFTAQALAEKLPDRKRPVLIYCNNNFTNNVAPVMLKSVAVSLNIQTFINLHAYGYAQVWELADRVDFNDPAVRWVKS
ncbi:rhodanese-like domain-containing protein [Sphingomonas bacterium]|uniref:rhodanese-like domain-containing protein n=1 Tax=Sphingomonas bacterium TaxID=1895847 RepID=UPI00262CC163|nr:rhodanese-like domain-containing protein [Sphingomonas bacterium]MDB5677055.1 sulfurtransferase [Sphingomonas bacterium]